MTFSLAGALLTRRPPPEVAPPPGSELELINPFSSYSLLQTFCYSHRTWCRHLRGPRLTSDSICGSVRHLETNCLLKHFISVYLFITLKIDFHDPDFVVRKSSVTAGREEQSPVQGAPLRRSRKRPLMASECLVRVRKMVASVSLSIY